MYLGAIGAYAASVLLLGSYAALAPLAVLGVVLVYRTNREDATLHTELPGYKAYASKVRYKLLPYVW
jgi:protein-S-isoprenylcysteine O-methyltransferase Ste14